MSGWRWDCFPTRGAPGVGAGVRMAALLAALMAGSAVAQSREIVGTVTQVSDGDSLRLTPRGGGKPVEVRLEGIDAPEICQEGGRQARDALREKVLNQPATLRATDRDEHGRTLGTLTVGGVNINDRMVRDGHAWSYRYKHDKGPYVAEERMARALQRGLHATAGALMPREFRKRNGPCPREAG